MLTIRLAEPRDFDAIWSILGPVVRAGEVFTLDREMTRDTGLAYWFSDGHEVFVAEADRIVVGSYYLRANQRGGGSHVANCGYMTAAAATGNGVARTMCEHSLERARSRGFKAMQFNFVICSNERAVRLWKSCGFDILCTLPKVFLHPRLGYVDAFVMYREL
ncbi:MAG TPA: GNAT family N-acetyltransferase [Edaphobacter sp.]|jgi:L-amino acid N-acyltransferase YncA|nr:GNAT family N-acetyltransferase [Edaphobacter sp.]